MTANRPIPTACLADNIRCSTWSAMSLFLIELFFSCPLIHKDPQRFCIWAPRGASWPCVAMSQCPFLWCKSSSRSRHHHVPALTHGCALTRVDDKLFGALIRVPNCLSVQTKAWSYMFNVWPNFTPSLRRDTQERRNGWTSFLLIMLLLYCSSIKRTVVTKPLWPDAGKYKLPQPTPSRAHAKRFFHQKHTHLSSVSAWLQKDNILLSFFPRSLVQMPAQWLTAEKF